MALVLGLSVGDVVDVDIADHWIAVLSVDSRTKATLIAKGGEKITVFSKGLIELVPDVWVQLGPWINKKHVKLLFEAPKSVPSHGADTGKPNSHVRPGGRGQRLHIQLNPRRDSITGA